MGHKLFCKISLGENTLVSDQRIANFCMATARDCWGEISFLEFLSSYVSREMSWEPKNPQTFL